MENNLFELRSVLECHQSDVRTVCGFIGENGFVSGSRDKTTKLYIEKESKNFELIKEFHGAKHFVSSSLVINFNNQVCLYIGTRDGNIYKYKTTSNEPCNILKGHESTVCCLNGNDEYKLLISSSWDKTVRIWNDNIEIKKLVGHKEAVWTAVIIDKDLAITGSADKTIKFWNLSEAKCFKTIDGHNDCIRDIKLINKHEFISCSNDALIKRWNLNGDLLETYSGHENYIYSLVIINSIDGLFFASCSEDKTLRVWKNGEIFQIIRLPSQTLWSVCKTQDNDLIVGCSNGKVYVYTQNKSLQASEEQRKMLEKEVSNTILPMSELGDIDIKKLPNKEVLNEVGKKDGEIKLIKKESSVEAYQWDLRKYEWIKVGDVVGTGNKDKDPSQKKEFEGKFYDYVFSVDLKDRLPLVKLPYNIDQNPWMVAQNFIDKHELNQSYLDTIANFIIKNSQTYFTEKTMGNHDPLTGGHSYVPSSSLSNKNIKNEYFPLETYFLFETLNLDGIKKKIKEFNQKVDSELTISNSNIESLFKLTDLSKPVVQDQIDTLKVLLNWPQKFLFPVLDLTRFAVLIPKISEDLCIINNSTTFCEILLNSITNFQSTPNQYLALRCMCNLFKNSSGENFMLLFEQSIFSKLNVCMQSENKNVQVALASLYMNYSVFLCKNNNENNSLKTDLAMTVVQMLQSRFDSETQFRALVALGTIVSHDKQIINLIRSEDLFNILQKLSNCKEPEKVGKCAKFLNDLFK